MPRRYRHEPGGVSCLACERGPCFAYLLDTNRAENEQHFRDLTLRVYGGDSTTRIMQEMLLGVGGVRLLRKLGAKPSVFHMNERACGLPDTRINSRKNDLGKKFQMH